MSFDSDIDAQGMAQAHALRVLSLEDAEAQKLEKVYRRVAARLRGRLKNTPRDTFTAQRMRVVLIQVEAALLELEKDSLDFLLRGARSVSEVAAQHTVDEVNEFNDYFKGALAPVNIDTQLIAMEYSQRLFNNYEVSMKTYTAGLRNKIATGIQDMLIEGATQEQMIERMVDNEGIGRFFAGEEWRLRRIARTELHGIYGGAKMATLGRVASQEPDIMKTLFHPIDSRTGEDSEQAHQLKLRVPVSEPFVYTFKTKGGKSITRTFMHPPDRPNDRSILIPYHPSWGK